MSEDPTKGLTLVPAEPEVSEPEADEIRNCFQNALNRHGYGFQYAVIKRAAELIKYSSRWIPAVAEFPVPLGDGTKIDFILRDLAFNTRTTLVCECKRVNEAFGRWCFVRAPFTHSALGRDPSVIMDSIEFSTREDGRRVRVSHKHGVFLDRAYSVGLVVKDNNAKGDAQPRRGTNEDAIEEAATQVLRGSNGYIETLSQHPKLLGEGQPHIVLPVIFTTATLWVSDANLSDADLLSGKIDIAKSDFKSAPWLWYQYHTSPALKYSTRREQEATELEEMLEFEYIRTIVIVGRGGIDDFLMTTSQRDLLSRNPPR
jgi:hypothetical protein